MPIKFGAGLQRCAVLMSAFGVLIAGASAASAATYTYTHYSATFPQFQPVHIASATPPLGGNFGMGEIHLTGTGGASDPDLNVFCMDIYHDLAQPPPNATMSIVNYLSNSGSGSPNPGLSNQQLSYIGSMVSAASAYINSFGTASQKARASGIVQLAIWEIEYQTNSSGTGGVGGAAFSGFSDANVLSDTQTFITAHKGNGSDPFNITLLQPLVVGEGQNNQDLVFIAVCGTDTSVPGCGVPPPPTPLPGAFPLLASGLGAMGLLGWRRKRKKAALAA